MKAVAMVNTKTWNNAYSTMRTANGLGFDYVYLIDLRLGKPRRMIKRKIDLECNPYNMIKLVTMNEFINNTLPRFNGVTMELTNKAENLKSFKWPENPLIIVGPEDGSVPDEIASKTLNVKIPMKGCVRCFNVACASSIAMYDYVLKEELFKEEKV